MKKILCFLLTFFLIIPAASCSKKITQPTPAPAPGTPGTNQTTTPGPVVTTTYRDGTYTGTGDRWEKGYENATITIKDGKITNITLRRLQPDGKEVDYNQWTGKTINGKTYPNLKDYRVEMAKRMIDKQSPDVDTISGATTTTNNWKVAVRRALDQAKIIK